MIKSDVFAHKCKHHKEFDPGQVKSGETKLQLGMQLQKVWHTMRGPHLPNRLLDNKIAQHFWFIVAIGIMARMPGGGVEKPVD
uniref:Uncharacterized protein n=1 Tax=Romanomermis culicivorax TaxID=13658 RepID=A0A915HZU3_ROMCU